MSCQNSTHNNQNSCCTIQGNTQCMQSNNLTQSYIVKNSIPQTGYYSNFHDKRPCHEHIQTVPQNTAYNALLAERENMRIQYSELQNDYYKDLENQKNAIITECEIQLEKGLREQEVSFMNQISELKGEITSLESKIVQKDKINSALQRDYDIVVKKCSEQHAKIQRQKTKKQKLKMEIEQLKKQFKIDLKTITEKKLKEQKEYLTLQWQNERNSILLENENMRKKIQELTAKISQIPVLIGDIEQFKVLVHNKNQEINNWKLKFSNMELYFQGEIDLLKENIQDISIYEQKITELKQKLQKDKQKPEVQVKETIVTVEKPVVVEKLVEVVKYVNQETIVREKTAPKQPIIIQELVQDDEKYKICLEKLEKKKKKIKCLKFNLEQQDIEFEKLEQQIAVMATERQQMAQLQAVISSQEQQIKELQRLLSISTQELYHHASQDDHQTLQSNIIVKNQNNDTIYQKVHHH